VLEPQSRSVLTAAFPSVFNACVWNVQQVQKSFFACIPAVIIRCWLGRQIKTKNPHSFLPIVQNEFCPVLLTTENSCFENYARVQLTVSGVIGERERGGYDN